MAHESDMVSSISSLLHFCASMSLATKEDDQSLLKTVVCNTQYVDRESLYASMFGKDAYVDWGALAAAHKRSESRKKGNPVGDATVWYNLLSYMSGNRKVLQKLQQQHVGSSSWLASMISGGASSTDTFSSPSSPPRVRYRPFFAVHDAIEATMGIKGGFQNDADAILTLSVRVFFILNLMGIVPITALDFLLSKSTKRSVTQQAQTILISVSSEKFTPNQYADTMLWLHSSGIVVVDSASMAKEIHHITTRYCIIACLVQTACHSGGCAQLTCAQLTCVPIPGTRQRRRP